MFHSEFLLVLYPVDTSAIIEQKTLGNILATIEFTGEQQAPGRFLVGEKFLSLLCFMGCSPDIELEPQGDKPYLYIEIPEVSESLVFMAGSNVKTPCCPNCKENLNTLLQQIDKTNNTSHTHSLNCVKCKHPITPHQLNWRKSAVFAHSMIIIGNIYESEAVPDARLLEALEKTTGSAWKYSYIRRSSA